MSRKKRILIFIDWYIPAFKGGGPIRSIYNFANYFKEESDIYILTSDRDLGDKISYTTIPLNQWLDIHGCHVLYGSPNFLNLTTIKFLVKEVAPDWIYLNSMFSWRFSILPLIIRRYSYPQIRVLLAPRGMLKASALRYKRYKKKGFLFLSRVLKLYQSVVFQATAKEEINEIEHIFGGAQIMLLQNLPAKQNAFAPIENKAVGELKMLFVGRIHPIKNLHFLLEMLVKTSPQKIKLTIAGKIDDEDYWNQCIQLIRSSGLKVEMQQDVPNEKINELLLSSHLFSLPTKGENFGHSILEALTAGRPVLISDQTPWSSLTESSAGWAVSLTDRAGFQRIIETCAAMNTTEINVWARGAWDYASQFIFYSTDSRDKYRKLFAL